MSIRTEMPLLARHEGEWTGIYTLIDAHGNIVDRHQSHLSCQFPDSEVTSYFQVNRYKWDDGRTEEHQFPATYRDGRIWFDTDRIEGSAWEVDQTTIILTWRRKDLPGTYLYEMIQLSPDGNHRSRTWHWFQDGKLTQRTLIEERKVQ